jgi:hypothetical protein
MIKNITIITLTITLLVGTLYHNTTVNTLQDKYDKTCVSSVKKSNRISQLVRQSTSDACSDCGFTMWTDSWCEYHMDSYINEIVQLKRELLELRLSYVNDLDDATVTSRNAGKYIP